MSNMDFTMEKPKELVFNRFMVKVYSWMAFALVITGVVSLLASRNVFLIAFVFGTRIGNFPIIFLSLIIGELIMVGFLARRINKLTVIQAGIIFIIYAALNGITISYIFLLYTAASIFQTFFITGGLFAVMSVYGYVTKTDLTKIGNLLFMGLIGIIGASILNFFLKSTLIYWIVTYVGIPIFIGLTAYNTQKLKIMAVGFEGQEETDKAVKASIIGALALYLDFINLFILLLRLFGRRK